MNREVVDAVLDALEREEGKSLQWGDVDGSFARAEILAVVAAVASDEEPEEVVESLIEASLVHEFEAVDGPRYRSRFGEAMRLLARLRQLFPGRPWRGGPPLVADFRIDRRQRRFPARNRDASQFEGLSFLSDVQRATLDALLAPFGRPPMVARFQEEALQRLLEPSRDQGTIVTAGTGSGKTLAFYLPAFLRAAGASPARQPWTKALALYPRNELLKDQASSAYQMAALARPPLVAAGRRPLRLGTYYGGTPTKATEAALEQAGWPRRPAGWICPFLRCPACGAEALWSKQDVGAAQERLSCIGCGAPFDPDLVVLTREQVEREPPDLLFTTTEMLNQRLSDTRRRRVFGVGLPRDRRPDMLLLDEAHTYDGTSGAQAALTLRRWRALVGAPVSWVGLSATLADAKNFFADLAGLDPARVDEITPAEADLVAEGCEYQVILRGDPASREALLSTTIQTVMLVARVLDPSSDPSEGRYGRKLFAFTDDLDVTNRLHDNLQDAEAYNLFGDPDPRRHPLADLRARHPGETSRAATARDADGQRWILPERVGHTLHERLVVGRTTSRDPGVEGRANVVVATAALEVGFNDPLVGAVLQHKAPRSFGAFLQRRGRAGRSRRMRPITVTVLSDFGRDRHLFQSYELLFEPRLAPQALPVKNSYVLRMQAAYALLDWLADQPREPDVQNGWLWREGAGPLEANRDESFRRHVIRLLGGLLQNEAGHLDSLRRHLRVALGIDTEMVERLLWEPPRALLLEAVPTMLRRLYRNFALAWPKPAQGRTHDRWFRNHPLPEFVPRTLFADLNLPEVAVVVPPATVRDVETIESLPILQALTQLPPGRVNRRFGDAYGGLSHWFPVAQGADLQSLAVGDYAEACEALGTFEGTGEAGSVRLPVFRPWRIRLQKARRSDIRPSANARLRWCSGFIARGEPTRVPPPAGTVWRGLAADVRLHLHQFRASVGVRRFATGCDADLVWADGTRQAVRVNFTDAGAPAALGFEFETDGLAVDLHLPSGDDLGTRALDPALDRAVSAAFLKRLVAFDEAIPRAINGFGRAWLRQAMVCAAGRRALARNSALTQAAQDLAVSPDLTPFEEALDALLGVQSTAALGGTATAGDEDRDTGLVGAGAGTTSTIGLERLKAELREWLRSTALRACLADAVGNATRRGAQRGAFLRQCLDATLADAFLAGVAQLAPRQASTDGLLSDLEPSGDAAATVWITETTLGGAGVIQAVAETVSREPRTLFRAVEASLEPSDLESAAAALTQTVRLAVSDANVRAALSTLRAEEGHDARAEARRRLLALLAERGVQVGRAFAAALSIRLAAPGTSVGTDRLIVALLDGWERAEVALNLALDLREAAVLSVTDPAVDGLARAAGVYEASTPVGERVDVLASLLWPRSDALHRETFAGWNPYRATGQGDPALLRALLFDDGPAVRVDRADWTAAATEALIQSGAVRLATPAAAPDALRRAMLVLQATAVYVGYLRLYPVLERVTRLGDDLVAVFVIRERI